MSLAIGEKGKNIDKGYFGSLVELHNKIDEMALYFELLPSVTIIHSLHDGGSVVYMCSRGTNLLGCTLQQLREMGTDYHKRYFNIEESNEYVPKILGLLERNNTEEMVSFFQQVRIGGLADWSLWLSSTKIFMRTNEGQPIATITTSIPVDPQHNFSNKVSRLIDENNFLRRNKKAFASLTNREREILRLMVWDKTSAEIAEQLFVSEDTIKTHRRNIKKKINASTYYDVVKFAQSFNML